MENIWNETSRAYVLKRILIGGDVLEWTGPDHSLYLKLSQRTVGLRRLMLFKNCIAVFKHYIWYY